MATRTALVAIGAAVIAAVAFARWDSPTSQATPGATAAPSAPVTSAPVASPRRPSPAPAVVAVAPTTAAPYTMDDLKLAVADPTADGTARLIDGLASDDVVVVAEAADNLVARRATEAIAALAAIDLDLRREVSPAVIDGLGRLGGFAAEGSAAHAAAVERLLALLRAEKQRSLPSSAATLLYLYEALGQTRDPRAAAALVAELGDPTVGTAPKVVVVESLAHLGQVGSRGPVADLRARVVAAPATDGFEAELQGDLVTAIDRALPRLR